MHAFGYKKDSVMFCVNGITMTAVFFIARILTIPVFWSKVYSIYNSELWIKNINFVFFMSIICLLLDIINIYWFCKLLKGTYLILWKSDRIKQIS
jgi:hypothetical protein